MSNKEKLQELRQHLFDCNLNYQLLSPLEKEKLLEQYEIKKREIRREIALCMMDERDDINDKYQRR